MKKNGRHIFVSISIIFLSFMVGLYGSRLFYFYNKEKKKDIKKYTLSEYITKEDNLIKGVLLKDGNNYYYHDNPANNYLYYSGFMYRIIYVNKNNVYAITDECITNLKFGQTENYSESNIKKWLNNVYKNNLNKKYLKGDINLFNSDDYAKIGAEKSFILNGDFWINDNNKAYVITESGLLTKTNNYSDFLGVRPYIKLDGTIDYLSGDGTKENPYILEQKESKILSDLYVGEYINFNNKNYRVLEKNDENVKLLSLEQMDKKYIYSYSSNIYRNYKQNDIGYQLNRIYIKNFNVNDLVKTKWNIGETELDYETTSSETLDEYVGLLKIGDYFTNMIPDSYLITPSGKNVYSMTEKNTLQVSEITELKDIYPVLSVKSEMKIKSGNGIKENPYIVGD